jgi:hypothetical protein
MQYYPDQRIVSKLSTIHRECLLPEEAIGVVRTHDGAKVEVRDVVANGQIPARHLFIEASDILGLRDKGAVEKLLLVKPHQVVEADTPIAGKRQDRGKRVFAPVKGSIVAIDQGRIIMQKMPELVKIEAGVAGRVIQVYPNRGVAVEAVGAIVQGVWGNGRSIISPLRIEPEQDLEHIIKESLDIQYKGAVIVIYNSLNLGLIELLEEGNINGVIAPSMPAELVERVLRSNMAIMLTEGFGTSRMNGEVHALLKEYDGYQVILDADLPGRWTARRPEVVINRSIDERPPGLNLNATVKTGIRVRITRQPHLGQIARVTELPNQPLLLPNGLRVMGARVELISGDIVNIPLANLELAGR